LDRRSNVEGDQDKFDYFQNNESTKIDHSEIVKRFIRKNIGRKKIDIKKIKADILENDPNLPKNISCSNLRKFINQHCSASFKKISLTKIGDDFNDFNEKKQLIKRFIVAEKAIQYFESFDFIFIDECWIQSDYSKFYSWGIKGEPIPFFNQGKAFKFGIYAAISKTNFLGYRIKNVGNYDSEEFFSFIVSLVKNLFRCNINRDRKIVLYMDNARTHMTDKIRNYCQIENLKIFYGAPYTPSFNPIEFLFNCWKKNIAEKFYGDEDELLQKIHETALNIDGKGLVSNFVKKSVNEWRKYIDKFKIIHEQEISGLPRLQGDLNLSFGDMNVLEPRTNEIKRGKVRSGLRGKPRGRKL
jgi:transposase